jgi:hypothetical protein
METRPRRAEGQARPSCLPPGTGPESPAQTPMRTDGEGAWRPTGRCPGPVSRRLPGPASPPRPAGEEGGHETEPTVPMHRRGTLGEHKREVERMRGPPPPDLAEGDSAEAVRAGGVRRGTGGETDDFEGETGGRRKKTRFKTAGGHGSKNPRPAPGPRRGRCRF